MPENIATVKRLLKENSGITYEQIDELLYYHKLLHQQSITFSMTFETRKGLHPLVTPCSTRPAKLTEGAVVQKNDKMFWNQLVSESKHDYYRPRTLALLLWRVEQITRQSLALCKWLGDSSESAKIQICKTKKKLSRSALKNSLSWLAWRFLEWL